MSKENSSKSSPKPSGWSCDPVCVQHWTKPTYRHWGLTPIKTYKRNNHKTVLLMCIVSDIDDTGFVLF